MAATKQKASRKKTSKLTIHKKRPGFDAFTTVALVGKNKKVVAHEKPGMPEKGIHVSCSVRADPGSPLNGNSQSSGQRPSHLKSRWDSCNFLTKSD